MEETIIGAEKKEEPTQPVTQEIFKAVYDTATGKIQIQLNTNHLPMLSYCLKLLELEVINKIMELNTKPVEEKRIIAPELSPIVDVGELIRTRH